MGMVTINCELSMFGLSVIVAGRGGVSDHNIIGKQFSLRFIAMSMKV